MRLFAIAAAAAFVSGCGGNPFRTDAEQARLAEQDELLLELERASLKPWPLPDDAPPPPRRPNLDAWKASVLESATPSTLAQMEKDERAHVEWCKAQVAEHQQSPVRVHHYAHLVARWELSLAETRLRLILEERR